jgi:hypothetical protein
MTKYVALFFYISLFLKYNSIFGVGKISKSIESFSLIDSHFFNSISEISTSFEILTAADRNTYLFIFGFDMLFLIGLFLLQGILFIKMLNAIGADKKYEWLILIPLLRSIFDFIENISFMLISIQYPEQNLFIIHTAALTTPVKWLLLWLSIAVLTILLFINIRNKIHKKMEIL